MPAARPGRGGQRPSSRPNSARPAAGHHRPSNPRAKDAVPAGKPAQKRQGPARHASPGAGAGKPMANKPRWTGKRKASAKSGGPVRFGG
jgi:hypothetical protein